MAEQETGDTHRYIGGDSGDPFTYKFTYPLTMEAQIRKLRQSLEGWREIALLMKSVFLWEQNWHPTALVGGTTIVFTLLWLLDPSLLTVIATAGLVVTVCDYLVPSLASTFIKPDKWSAQKEKEFEDLCISLVLYKVKTELAWSSYSKMRVTNRKMYYLVTIIGLVALAWIGNVINNLFLSYILVTGLLLLPGMERTGMLNKWSGSLYNMLGDFLDQAQKVGQIKKEK